MIYVYFPHDEGFPYKETKELYEKTQEDIGDSNAFDNVINKTLFMAFKEDDKLLGGIYYYTLPDDPRVYVNVFSGRKTHLSNLKCLKWSLNGFVGDIYAKTKHRHIRILAMRLGFKKISDDLLVYNTGR